jgi:beta-glucosidase
MIRLYHSLSNTLVASRLLVTALSIFPMPIESAPTQTRVPTQEAKERAAKLVAQMTLDEKLGLVAGVAGIQYVPQMPPAPPEARGGDGFVSGIPRVGIPNLQLIGAGLGITDMTGKRPNGQSTALPSTLALTSSFDLSLSYQFGGTIGEETRAEGFNVSLGGGVDLTRDPRGGRAFEYYGEDPVLAGKMVAATIRGTQDQGIVATIKHYALNDIENGRFGINVVIDERAMREAELLAFEIGIKESDPGSVMCSYNKINGVYACENPQLLNEILKKEWGYTGWVMSDGEPLTARRLRPMPVSIRSSFSNSGSEQNSKPRSKTAKCLRLGSMTWSRAS